MEIKSNGKQFLANFNKLDDKLQSAIDISLIRCGQEIQGKAKQSAPYLTGILRKSIRSRKEKNKVAVGVSLSSVKYARIQDLGGRAGRNHSAKIKGNKYLSGSFENIIKTRVKKIFDQELKNI